MVDAAFPRGSRFPLPRFWLVAIPLLLLVAIAGLVFLLRPEASAPRAGEYEENGVSFSYPDYFVTRGLADTPIFGDEHWVVSVGFEGNPASSVIVYGVDEAGLSAYSWTDAQLDAVMADLQERWDGGEILQPFTHTHVGSLQAIQWAYTATAFTGDEVRTLETLVIDPERQHMYRIQCQSTPALQERLDAACQQVLGTFEVD